MGARLAQPIVSLSEAQAFVRVETGEEEALLAGLIRTASAICETFLNQVVVSRPIEEGLLSSGTWQRLISSPVRSIENVTVAEAPLPTSEYSIDIDPEGIGWLQLPSALRCVVHGSAGMAADQNGVPEPIRQGVLRLVSHLYSVRDSKDDEPPASVTALWRPYRRLVLA